MKEKLNLAETVEQIRKTVYALPPGGSINVDTLAAQTQASKSLVIRILKELAGGDAPLGRFIAGRRQKLSRFERHAKDEKGKPVQFVSPLIAARILQSNGIDAEKENVIVFQIRADGRAIVVLPKDVTAEELDRLGKFVELLPTAKSDQS